MSDRALARFDATRRAGRRPQGPSLTQGLPVWGKLGAVGAALIVVGCLTSGPERIEGVRRGLIGVPARSLSACLGVPFDTSVDGDTEYLTYRWLEEDDGLDPFDRIERTVPRIPGSQGSRDLQRERADERGSLLRDGIGYCELIFEVREGRVRNVEVEGRRPSGLNDDFRCISTAQSCIPKKKAGS